jgi:hypothetical protein
MKRSILSLLIVILLINNAFPQVKEVNIDTYGTFEVVVQTSSGTVTINSTGDVVNVDTNVHTNFDYYTSSIKAGKIERMDTVYFDYYTTGIRTGKIEKIGAIYFDYYTTDIKAGKIEKIGATYFDYYDIGFIGRGQIEKIGTVYFQYHSEGNRVGRLKTGAKQLNSGGIIFNIYEDYFQILNKK